jgi:hypothetical protein
LGGPSTTPGLDRFHALNPDATTGSAFAFGNAQNKALTPPAGVVDAAQAAGTAPIVPPSVLGTQQRWMLPSDTKGPKLSGIGADASGMQFNYSTPFGPIGIGQSNQSIFGGGALPASTPSTDFDTAA